MIPFVSPEPVADFSQDTWWIWLIKAVAILVFLILSVLMALWVERRGLGRIQTRPGPNVIGPFGLFQAVADALKLILKEDFWLKGADKVLYLLAPIISAFAAFMVYAVIPFGPNVSMFGINTPLQLADMSVGVLYILAVTGFGVYGMVLGGWSARSTFSLLGGVRSSAQLISYELSMGLALVTVFIVSGSMSTSSIVAAQAGQWWVVALFPAFVIYFFSIMGEVNRVPFDLPEAEGEIVAGPMTEYSSMKFAWYYLAEYINMLNVSAVGTTLFLGGWLAPWPLNQINDGMLNTGWWPILWFLAKVWLVMFVFIWIRGTLLRVRYDQLMKLGWMVLIPAGLVWLVAVAVVQGIMNFTEIQQSTLLIAIAIAFGVVILLLLLWPERKVTQIEEPEAEFDAYAGGYPVPPMPGEQLQPSARRRRREAVLAMSAEEATDE
ncbi:MAG TPA: NADH-quinone oxidoreductase subunit NuoH [Actinomycetaceae bacterium]|nr:NADH-quinone oxidoreductase subunit NuoH [Actinomycetaceae bacterium]